MISCGFSGRQCWKWRRINDPFFQFVAAFSWRDASRHSKRRRAGALQGTNMNWPHAPEHWLFEPGIYMVTAGTYQKKPHLATSERRDFFVEALFERAAEFGWMLHAWAVLLNHYHFIAASPTDPRTLRRFLGKLHMTTSKRLNEIDMQPGRKVWFQY